VAGGTCDNKHVGFGFGFRVWGLGFILTAVEVHGVGAVKLVDAIDHVLTRLRESAHNPGAQSQRVLTAHSRSQRTHTARSAYSSEARLQARSQ
jgi:hypothetical protein